MSYQRIQIVHTFNRTVLLRGVQRFGSLVKKIELFVANKNFADVNHDDCFEN